MLNFCFRTGKQQQVDGMSAGTNLKFAAWAFVLYFLASTVSFAKGKWRIWDIRRSRRNKEPGCFHNQNCFLKPYGIIATFHRADIRQKYLCSIKVSDEKVNVRNRKVIYFNVDFLTVTPRAFLPRILTKFHLPLNLSHKDPVGAVFLNVPAYSCR